MTNPFVDEVSYPCIFGCVTNLKVGNKECGVGIRDVCPTSILKT